MLLKFSIENYMAFSSKVELDLVADLRTSKFQSNVIMNSQGNSVKTVAIFGPNNTGKTCLLNAVHTYRNVLLNESFNLRSDIFSESSVISLGAVFLWDDKRYDYSFKYDAKEKVFVEEEFAHITIDKYKNETKQSFFYRNVEKKIAESSSDKLKSVINISTKDNILIYALNQTEFPLLQEARNVLRGFAESITILSMQSLQPNKTMEMLRDQNSCEAKQIVELIKCADLDIDDFKYDEKLAEGFSYELNEEDEKAKGIHNLDKLVEMLKLTSIHKGRPLPSVIFDSLGTKKIVSLAGHIVDRLNKGGILIIDELDSGLHFKLSRAIVSLFNSSLNNHAQLVFSTHDASLLDIKTLFRKEQLWFTDKDDKQVYLFPLSAFTARDDNLRPESDVLEYYSKGLIGALPDPSLIDVLIERKNGDCDV